MSTMVQMPVRVKPPPADTGDTISPGWASFEIATPENGARITMSSSAVRCSATCCSATRICSRSAAMRAVSDSTSAFAVSISAAVTSPSEASRCRRACTRRASSSRTSTSGMAWRDASSWASASASDARMVESSRRASTWPARTAMPSSTFTSITLPVTFDDTVARRRAVT